MGGAVAEDVDGPVQKSVAIFYEIRKGTDERVVSEALLHGLWGVSEKMKVDVENNEEEE